MKAQIVKIGNSKGIRIPALILRESGIDGEVDLSVKGKSIVITPIKNSTCRKGWAKVALSLAAKQDDKLVIPDDLPTEEDGEN